MASITQILTTLAWFVTIAVALPAGKAPRTVNAPSCPGANTTARVYASALYTLFPDEPQEASQPVSDFHVQYNNQTGLNIQQAVVFGKFPKEATGCAFGWAQDDAVNGVLVAGGDGLLTGRQLTGFPNVTQGVSAAAVKPFDTVGSEREFHPDFTSWDREINATYHTSGPGKITCSEDIYLIFEKAPTTNGNVFLKKTEGAGLFIEYMC
ncbi:hypothetical protein GGS26DRAFT_510518 [Hypomontagnella submonticulosa]|nr:hypothetical protein GGS26DRAFT_510518 [Hypomontagnella submonticulosa]